MRTIAQIRQEKANTLRRVRNATKIRMDKWLDLAKTSKHSFLRSSALKMYFANRQDLVRYDREIKALENR